MKSVVVTGVSTGIGRGVAKVLIAKGFRVLGGVRKGADADRPAPGIRRPVRPPDLRRHR